MSTDEPAVERPIATVDLSIFALFPEGLRILLVRRGNTPFEGEWALPGGWLHANEDSDLEAAARRVLKDKTGIETSYLEQLRAFGDPDRDPRGWSISVAYMALIDANAATLRRGAATLDVAWQPIVDRAVDHVLAFDHAAIVGAALERLRTKVGYSTLPAHLLPDAFTLGELQAVYERILGRTLDKSAFRKRIAFADFLEPVAGAMRRASNRPAQLYRLKSPGATVLFDRTL